MKRTVQEVNMLRNDMILRGEFKGHVEVKIPYRLKLTPEQYCNSLYLTHRAFEDHKYRLQESLKELSETIELMRRRKSS